MTTDREHSLNTVYLVGPQVPFPLPSLFLILEEKCRCVSKMSVCTVHLGVSPKAPDGVDVK